MPPVFTGSVLHHPDVMNSLTHDQRHAQAQGYIWLSIMAAIATIVLKLLAWWFSGSVGLLSDALESFVNLAGAAFALAMISVARVPPDDEHPFGHSKAEYFSSGFEGLMICAAAAGIFITAIPRLLHPQALESLGIGLWFSAASTLLNFIVAKVLMGAAKRLRSIALEGDSRHLMTDVWTSIGVIIALGAVKLTGWLILDALIAIAVAMHILFEGWHLIRDAVQGLMDQALPQADVERIETLLKEYAPRGIRYAGLMTRQAGSQRFVHVNILVPGDWRVDAAHVVLDEIELRINATLGGAHTTTHLEPVELAPVQAS